MTEERHMINEGCMVVVQRGTYFKTCRVARGRSCTFGKRGDGQFTLNLDVALGCSFGSTFRMKQVSKRLFSLQKVDEPCDTTDLVREGGEDNRDLKDDGQSQKLSPEEISKLRQSGLSGKEVIQVITENSSTFKDKTVYSQEKYVSKKEKKYGEVVTLHRPTIRHLCNIYYTQDPLKIANMRVDSLSQLLCQANVQGGSNYGVFESGVQGLVTAAALHRMGTTGHLVQVYHGTCPQRDAVDLMNFTQDELQVLSFINFKKLADISRKVDTEPDTCTTNGSTDSKDLVAGEVTEQAEQADPQDVTMAEGEADAVPPSVAGPEPEQAVHKAPKPPRKYVRPLKEDVAVSSSVLQKGLDGLVVACRQHPSTITHALFPFLRPGFPFAIFSPFKEPLMDLFTDLKVWGGTNLRLSETWLRHYQVLPQRTHPEINMSGGGGYLLCGTRVLAASPTTMSP